MRIARFATLRQLRRRSLRIEPFQHKGNADAEENKRPDPMRVDGDHPHSREQEHETTDQKYGASDSTVESAIPKPVGEASDGHSEKACRLGRRTERTPVDSYKA